MNKKEKRKCSRDLLLPNNTSRCSITRGAGGEKRRCREKRREQWRRAQKERRQPLKAARVKNSSARVTQAGLPDAAVPSQREREDGDGGRRKRPWRTPKGAGGVVPEGSRSKREVRTWFGMLGGDQDAQTPTRRETRGREVGACSPTRRTPRGADASGGDAHEEGEPVAPEGNMKATPGVSGGERSPGVTGGQRASARITSSHRGRAVRMLTRTCDRDGEQSPG